MEKRNLIAVIVVLVASAPIVTGGVAAETPEPSFTVALQENGSATVTIRMTFNLSSPAERAAFESLANNRSARERMLSQFRDRLGRVVAATETVTGRNMSIRDVDIQLAKTNEGSVGIVQLSATWIGLAARKGNRLIVRQPFASGFDPERKVVLRSPEGYVIERASPEPDSKNATRVTWNAGSTLSGFEVVVEPNGTTTETSDGSDTPTDTRSESESSRTSDGTTPSPTRKEAPSDSSPGASSDGSPATDANSDGPTATGGQPGFGIAGMVAAVLVLALTRRWSG